MQGDSFTSCREQYEETVREIDEFIINEYKKWLEKYQSSALNRLKRSLIKNRFYQNGLLEVNIDR